MLLVLYAILRGGLQTAFCHKAFWYAGVGVVLTVTALLCANGYNNTAFLPSVSNPQSSLFITNASSSYFTLKVMAWVTLLIPVVLGYIAYVWCKMTTPPLTEKELDSSDHIY